LNFSFGLNYDARYLVTATRTVNGQPFQLWNVALGNYFPSLTTGLGWQINQGYVSLINSRVPCGLGRGTLALFHSHYVYQDAQGGKHPLAVRTGTGTCDSGSFILSDLQGPDWSASGIFAKVQVGQTASLYEANGTQVANGAFEDSNGNTLQQYPGGTDTLGRVIVTQQNGTNQVVYKIYDSSGTQQNYTVNYGTVSLATAFSATGQYGTIGEYTGNRSAITSIVLPNSRTYSFQYETGSYGAISRIDLPTGAYITYTWGTVANAGQGDHAFRYVTNRTLHVGSQSSTWTFSMV
jgi:hypothetical protein